LDEDGQLQTRPWICARKRPRWIHSPTYPRRPVGSSLDSPLEARVPSWCSCPQRPRPGTVSCKSSLCISSKMSIYLWLIGFNHLPGHRLDAAILPHGPSTASQIQLAAPSWTTASPWRSSFALPSIASFCFHFYWDHWKYRGRYTRLYPDSLDHQRQCYSASDSKRVCQRSTRSTDSIYQWIQGL